MEWKEILSRRISCRKYDARPVEREKLLACLEAARLAPSARNSQMWMFILVEDDQKRALVAKALVHEEMGVNLFAPEVPAFVVLTRNPTDQTSSSQYPSEARNWYIDMGIAAEHICLEATNLGLGSIIMARLRDHEIRAALDIPQELEVPLVIALGYPKNTDVKLRPRRPMNEIARLDSFSGQL